MCESEPAGDGAGIDNGAEQRWVSEPEGGGGGCTQQDRDGSLSMSWQEARQAWESSVFGCLCRLYYMLHVIIILT